MTDAVPTSKRLRLLVTVRDLRGRLVRDAIVTIRGVPGAKLTVASTYATFSNRLGRAGFLVRVPKQTLGKRLVLLVAATHPERPCAHRRLRASASGSDAARVRSCSQGRPRFGGQGLPTLTHPESALP